MHHAAIVSTLSSLVFVGCFTLVSCAASPAGTPSNAGSEAAAVSESPICLSAHLIDHTQAVDDNTLLFTMRDGKVWKNTLIGRCVGLSFNQGFAYETATDDICSNRQPIRLLHSGAICELGAFTPVPPAAP